MYRLLKHTRSGAAYHHGWRANTSMHETVEAAKAAFNPANTLDAYVQERKPSGGWRDLSKWTRKTDWRDRAATA